MEEFFEIVRQVLIPMFYKEAQLGRSLREKNLQFRKKLLKTSLELANKADEGTLKNEDIRNKIQEISKETNVSIGQAQKVLNVFLKYYCILTQKPPAIIRELDCPLDSKIMASYNTRYLQRTSLKKMDDINEYVAWQRHLEKLGNGIRLKPDIQAYDQERMKLFLST
jgi:hypothetical protein